MCIRDRCWGGATFDACLRFLKEDPWDRLRKLRDGFKNTKLQMLFRGQNILGYRPYADDVVEYFVQKSIANGIDIIRIFDCLNDVRNLQTAVTACNKEKGHARVALCLLYTSHPDGAVVVDFGMVYGEFAGHKGDVVGACHVPFRITVSYPHLDVYTRQGADHE